MLEIGIKGFSVETVDEGNIAGAVGSGNLKVYSTPSMIALIEGTCWKSVAEELSEGQSTVGTRLDVAHIGATPIGMEIRCESELVGIDRRRLVFKVEVFDDVEKVGEGTHERFIIDTEKFLGKVDAKAAGYRTKSVDN